MSAPLSNDWRFRLKRTDSAGSFLKYNSTLKNPDDETVAIGTPPQTAYTRLKLVSTSKNIIRFV
jgi:hypothetical protein